MKVTTLLTTYNHERFLAQALDSVLAQQTSFPFELVVLDDCSTDATPSIVRDYAKTWPHRIRPVFAAENRCSNRAFIDAFMSSTAEYIALLDGDDFWTNPDKLQRQVDFHDTRPDYVMCHHNATVFVEGATATWRHNLPDKQPVTTLDDLFAENVIAGCSPVIRRAALEAFPDWYENAPWGDWPLYILLAERGSIGYLNVVMGAYRHHPGGLWSSRGPVEQAELILAFLVAMDERLGRRHHKQIRDHIGHYRRALRIAKRTRNADSRGRSWVQSGGSDPAIHQQLRQLVARTVPADVSLAVITQGDASLLVLDGRPTRHFEPGGEPAQEQLFAGTGQGTAAAAWINTGFDYDFLLYCDADKVPPSDGREHLVAASTVTRAVARPDAPDQDDVTKSPPWLVASPNPVAPGDEPGRSTISWDTGDGRRGRVFTAARRSRASMLHDVPAALRHLDKLQEANVGYLAVPSCANWWLQEAPGVERHLAHRAVLVGRDSNCSVYALDGAAEKNKPAPTVSVIIPCFNQGHFLRDAIASVRAQTYTEIEIVVVDDGSTDDTGDVAGGDAEILYVRQENEGLAAARNAGLVHAAGDFCVFLDADDRLTPVSVSTGVEILQRHPECAFVSGHCRLIGPDGTELFVPDQYLVESDHYHFLLRNNYIWNPGSVVYRRAVLEAFDGFDPGVSAAADYDLYLRITRLFPVHCHGTVVAEYRQHGSNMSGNAELMLRAITRILRSHAENVRGDARAEDALAAGLDAYGRFYGDPKLQEMREHWARRLPDIERRLVTSSTSRERHELLEEVRYLYRSMLDVFGMRMNEAVLSRGERRLRDQLESAAAAVDSAQRAAAELAAPLATLPFAAAGVMREVRELQAAITEFLGRLGQLHPAEGDEYRTPGWSQQLADARDELEYRAMLAGVRSAVTRVVPTDGAVLVVSRGDDALLDMGGPEAHHFPQVDGVHAGCHFGTTSEVLAHIKELSNDGRPRFFIVPATEMWWFDTYIGLEEGLNLQGACVWHDSNCLIYRLEASG